MRYTRLYKKNISVFLKLKNNPLKSLLCVYPFIPIFRAVFMQEIFHDSQNGYQRF